MKSSAHPPFLKKSEKKKYRDLLASEGLSSCPYTDSKSLRCYQGLGFGHQILCLGHKVSNCNTALNTVHM